MSSDLQEAGVLTAWLRDWAFRQEAGDRLFDSIYPELRRLAARQLSRERSDISIEAADLVSEAYLRLSDQRHVHWRGRAHFFAIAATCVRRVLTDHAKHKLRSKRGAGAVHVQIEGVKLADEAPNVEILALNEALVELAEIRASAARVVELRAFGGLDLEDTASVLGMSRATVIRRWRFARAWLAQRLRGSEA